MTVVSTDYNGIWYDLGQANEYGSKYSGGLATYTAKHRPLAIYSSEAKKTFFVYGGAPSAGERYLLCMIGAFDHTQGGFLPPTLVHDKNGVDDPHDNPSIALDEHGFVWVFVSGRGASRPGYVYRSRYPHDISEFEETACREFTYPQPIWIRGQGFFHFFTKYTGLRELYFNCSVDGRNWSKDVKLAGIGGHYQLSDVCGNRLATTFNRHPGGDCDLRTDLYYVETADMGATWQTVDGQTISLPIEQEDHPARVRNYSQDDRLVYMKDLNFDEQGRPIILILTSSSHQAGPAGAPRNWEVAHWTGKDWEFSVVTQSTHNYDMGSLYVEGDLWRIIAPTGTGPQQWGQGGEIEVWESVDQGRNWKLVKAITENSLRNHSYVRRPVNAQDDFYAFWCDGDPTTPSSVNLYYLDRADYRIQMIRSNDADSK